jgi:hypothetical protein
MCVTMGKDGRAAAVELRSFFFETGGAQIREEEGGRGRGVRADAYSFGKGHF